ncbi:hypothetical protein ACIBQ6_05205 [Nonomuraea sp. NPDC049655]|uniref:hypothetical protein n=1 Tax=Nonomuraea sp. NPDC049655 TaxID=3364355 RepID=UPI00378A8C7F
MPTSTTAVPAGRALGPVLLGGVGVLLAMDVIGALMAVAGVLAFVSGFYDGGYAAELTAGQRVYQIALVSAHLAVAVVAALRLAGLLRRPARS